MALMALEMIDRERASHSERLIPKLMFKINWRKSWEQQFI